MSDNEIITLAFVGTVLFYAIGFLIGLAIRIALEVSDE